MTELSITHAAGLAFDDAHVRRLRGPGYDYNDDIAVQPIQLVDVARVTHASQPFVVLAHLGRPRPDPLHLIRTPDERLTVWDGHHRYTDARTFGRRRIAARILDLNPEEG